MIWIIGFVIFLVGLFVGIITQSVFNDVFCNDGSKHEFEIVDTDYIKIADENSFCGCNVDDGPGVEVERKRTIHKCKKCGYVKTVIEY